jgi:hypothetical protein
VLVGIVRPLILLPSIAVGGWSPEQIEMVLVHELAHVRRWDNLVNLIQRFVESLLFFHPAIWLMSAWLRRDREECCDAVVVGHTREPRVYAETLLAIAAQAAGAPFPMTGVALTGQARRLADRIRAILGQPNDPMLVSRRTLAAALVVLICTVAFPLSYFPRDSHAEETDAATDAASNMDAVTEADAAASSDHDAASDADQRLEVESDDELRLGIHPKSEKPSRFPSLEEQKLADLAWKRLKIELEPISQEELNRVRALGFDGGVKVSRATDISQHGVWTNDLLVGLHVWPTTSLNDVTDVLNRNDLAEINPLKFYVVRHGYEQGRFDGDIQDRVITGRIEVSLPSQKHATSAIGLPVAPFDHPDHSITGPVPVQHSPGIVIPSSPGPAMDSPFDLFGTPTPAAEEDPFGGEESSQQERVRNQLEQQLEQQRKALFDQLEQLERKRFELQKRRGAGGPEVDAQLDAMQQESSALAQQLGMMGVKLVHTDDQWLIIDDAEIRLQPPAARKRQLLYDGKTFYGWRRLLETELKPENRAEAVRALAAFGASGHAGEAAEAILDVAEQCEWQASSEQRGLLIPAGELQKAIAAAFVGGDSKTPRIDAIHWLPLLFDRLQADEGRFQNFGIVLMTPNAQLGLGVDIDPLLKLTREKSSQRRYIALLALAAIDRQHKNPRITARWQELLQSDDSSEVMDALNCLKYSMSFHSLSIDWLPLLSHSSEKVRREALRLLESTAMNNTDLGRQVGVEMLRILQDPQRSDHHLAAIYGLAVLRQLASDAYATLDNLMMNREHPLAIRTAAMQAIERIGPNTSAENRLREDVLDENREKRDDAEGREEFRKLENAIREASQSLP